MRKPSILPRSYQQSTPRLRGAPQFASRGTWWKLFAMCGSLMLVLMIAEQIRKPNAWLFFDKLDGTSRRNEVPPDPKILPPATRTQFDPAGTFVSTDDTKLPLAEVDVSATADLVERAWQQGWKEIWPALPADQRGTVYEALWRARQRELLSGELMTELAIVADALDGRWSVYQTDALGSLADLPEADRANWSDVMRQTDLRWKQEVKPALASLSDGRSPTDSEFQSLVAWQSVLDQLQLKAIKDDTVWRGSEREIWFRMLERVKNGEGIDEASHATYSQLFKQSKDYRGQWVQLRGTARQAYRVKAPENWLDINYYYVFVVQPEDGANSPIIVYSLEVPAGLPPIKDKDTDRGTTALHDDVSFTGLYFKRWAYLGQDGTYVAPLVLAKAGTVHRSPVLKAKEDLPSPEFLATIIGGVLVAAVGVTGFAFWITGRGRTAVPLPSETDVVRSLNALEYEEKRAPR